MQGQTLWMMFPYKFAGNLALHQFLIPALSIHRATDAFMGFKFIVYLISDAETAEKMYWC